MGGMMLKLMSFDLKWYSPQHDDDYLISPRAERDEVNKVHVGVSVKTDDNGRIGGNFNLSLEEESRFFVFLNTVIESRFHGAVIQ